MGKTSKNNGGKGSLYKDQSRNNEILGLGKEAGLYAGLFQEVADFINKYYGDIVDDFLMNEWSEVFPEGPEASSAMPFMMTFFDWLMHSDSIIVGGYTGLELYLEKADHLPSVKEEMVERMNDSSISLFELRASEDRKSVRYRDLLLGDEFELKGAEITGGSDMAWAGVRRIVLDGHLTAGIATYPFLIEEKEDLLEAIREDFEDFRIDEPEADMEEYLRIVDPIPNIWLEGFEEDDFEDGDFEGQGDDGSPPVTYTALFDVLDRKRTLSKLRTSPSLHKVEKNVFEWIDNPDDPEQESRGTVVIMEDNMAFGAFTPEMREAGKIMLLSVCSGLIRHRTDLEVNEDLLDALEEE
jgi:hypothetical protein